MFLAIGLVKIVDVEFIEGVAAVPAVPEIVADPAADPPVIGVPGIPEIVEVIEADEVSHNEVSKVFIEANEADVVANLAEGALVEYYEIDAAPGTASLNSVTIKGGTRTAAPDREVVEIEADGSVVGSAHRDK